MLKVDAMFVTQRFARFIAQTSYEDLPTSIVALAKERIMDTIGAAIAGAVNWEYAAKLRQAVTTLGGGSCGVVGSSERCFSPAHAAMINAAYAHSVELDDGHKNAGCHAGAVVIPTALTLGQALGSSGRDILAAAVLGYEITYRIASHINPAQINKGFHPSSNCGVFGAAAVAGKLLGLDSEQLTAALGQAAMLASGTMEATKSGQRSKCVQVGNAAYNGIMAATLARSGMEGCLSAFEGASGLFRTQSEDVDIEDLFRGLGEVYTIGDTYSKLYPTCRHSQPAIEAALDMGISEGIDPNEVASIRIGTHRIAYELTGLIKAPRNAGEAKFSLAYGCALALREHAFGIAGLSADHYTDADTLALAEKVVCEIDPAVQAQFPRRRGAKVRIALRDGRVFEKELYDLKGSPNNPIGWAELEKKFMANATALLRCADAARILELVSALDTLETVDELMALLCK